VLVSTVLVVTSNISELEEHQKSISNNVENWRAYQDKAMAVAELKKQEQRESMGAALSHRPSAKNNKIFVKLSRVDGCCLVTGYCPSCCSKMTMMTPQLALDHLKNLACKGCSFLLERFDLTS
jgi:hypothetical protein